MTTENQSLPETAILGALWRYKGLILAFTIIAVGAGHYFAERATPMYEAEASILFRFDREYTPRNLASESWHGEPIRVNLDGALNNEMEILGSRRLLEESLALVGPAPVNADSLNASEPLTHEQQLAQIRNALSIRRVEGTSVARLSYTHADPDYATEFLRALVETHITTRTPLLNWSPSESLREVMDWSEARLVEAQRNLNDLRTQSGMFDVASTRADLLDRRTGLRLELMRLEPDAPAATRSEITRQIDMIEAELATLSELEPRLEALTSAVAFATEQYQNARDIFAEQELSERLAIAQGPSILVLDQPATDSQPVGVSALVTSVLSGTVGFSLACLLALWLARSSLGTRAQSKRTSERNNPPTKFIAPRSAPSSHPAKQNPPKAVGDR